MNQFTNRIYGYAEHNKCCCQIAVLLDCYINLDCYIGTLKKYFMEYTQIDIESKLEGKLKIAYLNQPESYNSLNKKMLSEIRHFMEECDKDEKVRCIAISGRGKAFCSGQNLKEAFSIRQRC